MVDSLYAPISLNLNVGSEVGTEILNDSFQPVILKIASHLEFVHQAYEEAATKGELKEFVDEFATADPNTPVIVCAYQRQVNSTTSRRDGSLTYGLAELVSFYRYGGIYRNDVESPATVTVQELVTEDEKKFTFIDIKAVQLKVHLENNGASRDLTFHGRVCRFIASDEGYELIDLSYSRADARIQLKFDKLGNLIENVSNTDVNRYLYEITMVLNIFEVTLATQFK